MTNKINNKSKKYKTQIKRLISLFKKISDKNINFDIVLPEKEDELYDLYYHISRASSIINNEFNKLTEKTKSFKEKINEKTTALEHAQKIAHLGSWEWDVKRNMFIWSEEMYRIFQLKQESTKLTYNFFLQKIHPDDRENVNATIRLSIKTQKPFHINYRILLDNGTEKYIHGKGNIIKDEKGEVKKILATAQDISELKKLEKALKSSKTKLEERVAERTRDLERAIRSMENENILRRNIESELKQSELKYRSLVETMSEGLIVVDNNDIITYINKKFCEISGYSEKELIGKSASKILLSEEEKEKMKYRMRNRAKGVSEQYELPIFTKSGERKWLLISASTLYGSNGMPIGSMGIHTDITERKSYEKKLDSLAKFPDEDPNPVMRIGKNGIIQYLNSAGIKLMNHWKLKAGLEIPIEWKQLVSESLISGKVKEFEIEVDGRAIVLTLKPVIQENYINIYGHDITPIKLAESKILKLTSALDKAENSIVITDKNWKIEWVNKGFEQLTGYTIDEVRGTYGEVLRKGKNTGISHDSIYHKRLIKEKQTISYESSNYSKSGRKYWIYTTLTPIVNDKGEIQNIVAIDSDISTRKEIEKKLLQAKQLAEESTRVKEIFLANMSHEIRTPMNAIMGIVQLLQDTKLSSEQSHYLKSMRFAADNLLGIINDILDLSKLESGKVQLENIPFNPIEVVSNLVDSMQYQAREKNLILETQFSNKIPKQLMGDPVRLSQIIMNLLSNAIKFTDYGRISVQLSASNINAEFCRLTFVVSDTGIGIPKEKLSNIFNAFEQIHTTSTQKYKGTGLGLSIIKKLTEIMNGKIEVQSTEGHGSVFTVKLEYKVVDLSVNNKIKHSPVTKAINEISLSGINVLLVEDNDLNQMVASKFMSIWGVNVDVAKNGEEAISKLKNNTFDLVLMDIQMPVMNGYDATTHIRNKMKPPLSNIPIIAMTAHAFRGEEEKCIKMGMNAYLSKPINRNELKLKIAQVLNLTNKRN